MVSVVVVAHNRLELTEQCYAALQIHAGCDFEFILVDNGSTDGTRDWALDAGIPFVRLEENVGAAKARNLGARRASGDVLAFFDNDAFCQGAGLYRLRNVCQDRGVAAQSGSCWSRAGHYQGDSDVPGWCDGAGGYCLTMRRDVWEDVGGFDPAFPKSGCEDIDWCLRARLKGYDFRFVAEAVHHLGHGTVSAMATPEEERAWIADSQALLRGRYYDQGLGFRALLSTQALDDRWLRLLKQRYPLCRVHSFGPWQGHQTDHWVGEAVPGSVEDYALVFRREAT